MKVAINQEEAMNTPSIEVFRTEKIVVTESLIPYDRETATVMYFVDKVDGKGICSGENKQRAIDLAVAMTEVM